MNHKFSWVFALSLLCTAYIHAESNEPSESTKVRTEQNEYSTHNSIPSDEQQDHPIQKSATYPFQVGYMPFYRVENVSFFGETLTTDDGTIWRLSDSPISAGSWWDFDNANIVISPGSWCFSNDYLLTNTATQKTVRATLSAGPFKTSSLSITYIDYFNTILTLSDGSNWQVCDDSILNSWTVGETILLGVNAGWRGGSNILINIEKNDYLPANKFL